MTVNVGPNPNLITGLVSFGLTLRLESNFYTGGNYWEDLSGNNYDFLINPNAYKSAGPTKYMDFEGSYGMAKRVVGGSITDVPNFQNATFMIVSEIKPKTGDWRTLIRGGSADHQVIIQNNQNNLGMYDNNGAGFVDSGFDINTVPNHTTSFNFYHWKFSQSSPYYTFGYNNNLNVAQITNANARFNNGFYSIGGWHNFSTDPNSGSQFWGKFAAVYYYNRHLDDFEIQKMYSYVQNQYNF